MTDEYVDVQLVAGVPRAVWCNTCQTAAGYEVDVLHLADDGPRSIGRTITGCLRCDGEDL